MSINLDELKRAAKAAHTGATWQDYFSVNAGEPAFRIDAEPEDRSELDDVVAWAETQEVSTFLVRAQPSTVLALIERLERAERALNRIALNISGDLPAQVIAGDAAAGREPGT